MHFVLKGKYMSKRMLAEDAIKLEREILKEHGGWQDQIAAAYGGFNRIDFKDNQFSVRPIVINPDRKKQLEENLMLFYTGIQRFSSDIQKNTFSNPQDKVKQLLDILSLVDEAESILSDKNVSLNEFGKLLDLTWKLKKGTGTKVTLSSIDDIYNKALQAGVIGGKLLGAGGGGFLLFYVEKDKQEYVKKALSELMAVPFNFEDEGASIVYYKPIVYIPRKEIILK